MDMDMEMEQETVYSKTYQGYVYAIRFWMTAVVAAGFIWTWLSVLIVWTTFGGRVYNWFLAAHLTSSMDEDSVAIPLLLISLLVATLLYFFFPYRYLSRKAKAVVPDPGGRYVTQEELRNKAFIWRFIGALDVLLLVLALAVSFLFALAGGAAGTTA